MMRTFLGGIMGGPNVMGADDDFMDVEMDPEDVLAIMDAMGEHPQEKVLDADFFNDFDDDFDDDDLK